MDVNHLASEELKYELCIRGLPTTGSFAQKRATLREVLRSEKQSQLQPPSGTSFGVESELCLCRGKVFAMERDIRLCSSDNQANEVKRLNTILVHVLHRLQRVHPTTPEDEGIKEDTFHRCKNLKIWLERLEQRAMEDLSNLRSVNEEQGNDTDVPVSHDLIVLDEDPNQTPEASEAQEGSREARRLIRVPDGLSVGFFGVSSNLDVHPATSSRLTSGLPPTNTASGIEVGDALEARSGCRVSRSNSNAFDNATHRDPYRRFQDHRTLSDTAGVERWQQVNVESSMAEIRRAAFGRSSSQPVGRETFVVADDPNLLRDRQSTRNYWDNHEERNVHKITTSSPSSFTYWKFNLAGRFN